MTQNYAKKSFVDKTSFVHWYEILVNIIFEVLFSPFASYIFRHIRPLARHIQLYSVMQTDRDNVAVMLSWTALWVDDNISDQIS